MYVCMNELKKLVSNTMWIVPFQLKTNFKYDTGIEWDSHLEYICRGREKTRYWFFSNPIYHVGAEKKQDLNFSLTLYIWFQNINHSAILVDCFLYFSVPVHFFPIECARLWYQIRYLQCRHYSMWISKWMCAVLWYGPYEGKIQGILKSCLMSIFLFLFLFFVLRNGGKSQNPTSLPNWFNLCTKLCVILHYFQCI